MALYPGWSPWLSKPAAALDAAAAIVESAVAARGAVGYLDFAGVGDERDGPFWLAPRSRSPWPAIEDRDDGAGFDAADDSLAGALERTSSAPAARSAPGTFVFVVSDFLEPPPPAVWRVGARRAAGSSFRS